MEIQVVQEVAVIMVGVVAVLELQDKVLLEALHNQRKVVLVVAELQQLAE
jgi:hypothetical protein